MESLRAISCSFSHVPLYIPILYTVIYVMGGVRGFIRKVAYTKLQTQTLKPPSHYLRQMPEDAKKQYSEFQAGSSNGLEHVRLLLGLRFFEAWRLRFGV